MAPTLLVSLLVLFIVSTVTGHSWVACTDYQPGSSNDGNYYNGQSCKAFARNWQSVATNTFGEDRGYNFQGGESAPCRDPYSDSYPTAYPMAVYSVGQNVCIAWPSKNHVAESCTNQYIPDTQLSLFAIESSNTNPSQGDFKNGIVIASALNGQHQNGQIDHKGFQNCPKFCENMDKSLCTGCFTIPNTLQSGKTYTFQWYWIFNEGSTPYTTCWEAKISGSSGGQQSKAPSRVVAPTPAAPSKVPLQGDATYLLRYPTEFPISSEPFTVAVQYSTQGARWITVDILYEAGGNVNWFGKGVYEIESASTGTANIQVHIDRISDMVAGRNYILRLWVVDAAYWTNAEPWAYELSRYDVMSKAGSSLSYPEGESSSASRLSSFFL
eukprot:TRINITY_DN3784_c0_g1_i1.p1 TRINITY_DN3784_c0_g1~~TRINITY_DN3784_c0_g1_i1.p1  ORF type:complete len:383 (-),score=67.68 TRINITY_DN3784_c0_g1_i1:18-1166(-)